jgi:hypothetical protein
VDTRADLAASPSTDDWNGLPARYVDRRLVGTGAVLMTGGLVIWLSGATLGMIAVVSGCRRYLAAREEPPRETVRRRLGQARTAMGAGYGAWQGYGRS